ncbi:MAG: hypothetical protein INQ03_05395 [Candidatus Heimdallarchaeota archaeon]|nr:hypothetical protein [Candidatus Heimdallarchaeota archaeon]
MSYCEICDEILIQKNIRGKLVDYCPDCKKYFGMDAPMTESNTPPSSIKPKKTAVQCRYCSYQFEGEELKNLGYYLEMHMAETHPEEYEIEQSDDAELFDIVMNSNHRLAVHALERIESDEVLHEIIKQSFDGQLQKIAVLKIEDPHILDSLSKWADKKAVRDAAKTRYNTLYKFK